MAKTVTVPQAPEYLGDVLSRRFNELAPELAKAGILDRNNRDLLAKYVLAENEYLQVSNYVQAALRGGDPDATGKWLAAQDKLTRQILSLGNALGITPDSRRSFGLPNR